MSINSMSQIMALKEFFGFRPGTSTLKEFSEEAKQLSTAEKEELSLLAKAEMIRRGTHVAEAFSF